MNDIPFDAIGFGNPPRRDHEMMQKESYLDQLLPALYRFTPPPNSSPATKHEIELLMQYISTKREVKNNLYDNALLDMLKEIFIKAGADEEFITTVTNGIAEDVIPIITKLKYKFNRPRPAQLSWYYDLNFFPDFSYFTNSPSYPSSHSCLTVITAHVLGNLFPEGFNKVMPLIDEVKKSRLHLGVHYPSDNDMSMIVAKAVLDNPEFKATYNL